MAPDPLSQGLVRLMLAVDELYTGASREVGLTAQQAQLLCAAQRSAAVGDIATLLHCDRSNVSRLVDRAAARGLVERGAQEADGRVTLVSLTDEGRDLVQRFIRVLNERLDERLSGWPRTRRAETASNLHALAAAIEAERAPQRPVRPAATPPWAA